MIVWRLQPEHAEEWRRIRLQASKDAPESFEETYDDWADRPLADFAARLSSARVFAAGTHRGRALAIAGCVPGLDLRDASRGWVVSVFTRPEARGRGLAGAVIQTIMSDAAMRGMTSLGLHVVASNATAIALYERLGFRDSGQTGIVSSRGLPEIEMLRVLS
ncbi:GNAT family N-acetyltransferase [Paracoccus sp. TK19116]|uniref:GNAT family N-acetyltransferase n=1 Tax=Paracoccus albicereus TaxID=2922394 RepID=A0ABT1MQ14_9RHOB|nr:GNAT family N-acetyltransferase [Paracoccus albicereus]MCQ0970382.1 GNAT family N-acetyltransferase [Paracoccus albicereus]